MRKLYTIGETAKLNDVSIQALRLYDKIGLIKPSYVNKDSGYRYYSSEQFIYLDIIRYSKYIGLPLAELKRIFNNEDLMDLRKLLIKHKETIYKEKLRIDLVYKDIKRIISQLDEYNASDKLVVNRKFIEEKYYVYKRIDEEIEDFDQLDFGNRLFEVELTKKKMKLNLEYGQTFKLIDNKAHFLTQYIEVFKESKKKEICPEGEYLSVLFDKGELYKAIKVIDGFKIKNSINTEETYIINRHLGTSFFEIYELKVRII